MCLIIGHETPLVLLYIKLERRLLESLIESYVLCIDALAIGANVQEVVSVILSSRGDFKPDKRIADYSVDGMSRFGWPIVKLYGRQYLPGGHQSPLSRLFIG